MKQAREAIMNYRREWPLVTFTRRFCRRAQRHGLTISEPVRFHKTYSIVELAGRVIRIDADGVCLQFSTLHDPGWRANFARMHACHLALAARYRRRGAYGEAERAVALCARDRPFCPPLPA